MSKLTNAIIILLLLFNTFLLLSQFWTAGKSEFVKSDNGEHKIVRDPEEKKSNHTVDSTTKVWNDFREKYPHLVDSINILQANISIVLDSIDNVNVNILTKDQELKANTLYFQLNGINRKLSQVIDKAKLLLLEHDIANLKTALAQIDRQVASLKKVANITDKITAGLGIITQLLDTLTGSGIIKPAVPTVVAAT